MLLWKSQEWKHIASTLRDPECPDFRESYDREALKTDGQETKKSEGVWESRQTLWDRAPCSGLSRAESASDSSRETEDQPWLQPGFVSLHHENMAWNPIIPGYRDARAPSSSLIPRHRGYHLHCIYIEGLTYSRLQRLFIGEGQIELEWRMDDTHLERQLHSQSPATLATKP